MGVTLCLVTFLLFSSNVAFGHRHNRNNTKRIVNGVYTSITNYPYQTVLDYWNSTKYVFLCGGSLISTKHVLTAGHCTYGFQKNNFLVKVGLDGLQNVIPNQMSYVDEIYIHEQYYVINTAPINDIALMKLSQQFTFNSNVQPIPLPSYGSNPSSSICTITGFGKTKTSDVQPSPYLMKADVTIINNQVCKAAIKALNPTIDPPIMDTHICTMDQPTKGSCSGDSGGPLAQGGKLIGVVSFGVSPCESNNNPTVYTEVSKYTYWISTKMAL